MINIIRRAVTLTGLFFIVACTDSNTVTKSNLKAWKSTYKVTDVTVNTSKNVAIINLPMLSQEKQAELKQVFPANMLAILNAKALPEFTGARPVKLDVTVESISIPSGTGRAFGGTAFMTATARLFDSKTGTILETKTIRAEKKAFRGEGAIVKSGV